MSRSSNARSCKPALELLEGRDLPSTLPGLATSFLLPLAQQESAASTASLARLRTADTALHQPSTTALAATQYAQAASAYQDVLTERRALELSFLSILDFFGNAIQAGGDFANDLGAFVNTVEPQLNVFRQQVINNEAAANALPTVAQGETEIEIAITVTNGALPAVQTFSPLLPSKGAGVVTVPQFNYSASLWPLAYSSAGGYTPPANP